MTLDEATGLKSGFLWIGDSPPPADPDEVADAVAYLVRSEAGFVTGQVLSVNGGSSMG